jgi:hypothetical protein
LCTRMTDVTIMATTPPELGDYNFDRNPSHKSSRKSSDILHVPASCVAAYEADEAWRTAFTNIVEQQ